MNHILFDIEKLLNKLDRLYMENECLKVTDTNEEITERCIRYLLNSRTLNKDELNHLYFACIYCNNVYSDKNLSKEKINIISTQFRLDQHFLTYLVHDLNKKLIKR